MATTLPAQAMASLLAGPAASPPPGVVVHLGHSLRGPTGQYIAVSFVIVLLTLSLALRLFTCWYLAKRYVIEDFAIVLAWATGLAFSAGYYMCLKYGVGHHMWDLSLETVLLQEYWVNISSILFCPAMILVKTSIVGQILRTFAPNRHHNAGTFFTGWVLMILVVVYLTVQFCAEITFITPKAKAMNPFIFARFGPRILKWDLANCYLTLIADTMILILPLPCILKLRMKLAKNIMIAGLFCVGSVAVVVSVLRLRYILMATHSSYDATYELAPVGLCSIFELAAGFLVFCLPVTPRFLTFMKDMFRTSVFATLLGYGSKPSLDSDACELRDAAPTKHVAQARQTDVVSLGVSSIDQYLGPQSHFIREMSKLDPAPEESDEWKHHGGVSLTSVSATRKSDSSCASDTCEIRGFDGLVADRCEYDHGDSARLCI